MGKLKKRHSRQAQKTTKFNFDTSWHSFTTDKNSGDYPAHKKNGATPTCLMKPRRRQETQTSKTI